MFITVQNEAGDWVEVEVNPSEPPPENNEPPPENNEPPQETNNSMQGDPSHNFVRTDSSGDVWELIDAAGTVLQWSVPPGGDSRDIISGTLHVVAPAPLVIASAPTYNPPPQYTGTNTTGLGAASSAPPSAPAASAAPNIVTPPSTVAVTLAPNQSPAVAINSAHIASAAGHRYVGTVGGEDIWQLTDAAGNVVQWRVKINDDSRNVIPGSLVNGAAPVAAPTAAPPVSSATVGTGGGGVSGTAGVTNNVPVPTGLVNFTHPVSRAVGQIPNSWVRVGTKSNGDPTFQIRDEAGNLQTFSLDKDLQAYFGDAATVGASGVVAAPDASKATLWLAAAGVVAKLLIFS